MLERYLIAVLVFGVLLAPVALATGAATLAPLLVVAGLAVGPAAVSTFESLDVLAPGRRRRGVHLGDDRRGRRAGRSAPRSRACS